MLIVWIAVWLVAAVLVWLMFWTLLTFLVGKSARQDEFVAGSPPQPAPDGFYRGVAYLLGGGRVAWEIIRTGERSRF